MLSSMSEFIRDFLIGCLLAANQILSPQNATQSEVDVLVVTTDDQLEKRYARDSHGRRDSGIDRNRANEVPAVGVVGKKILLTRQQGLRFREWGHTVSFESTIPSFTGESRLLQQLNGMLRKESEAMAAEFGSFRWFDVIEGILEPIYSAHHVDGMLNVEVIHVSPDAVSLLRHEWEYTGGIHGNGYSHGQNFVFSDDRILNLKLADLFDPNSRWAERLIASCRDELRSQKARWMMEPEIVDPRVPPPPAMPTDDDDFFVSDDRAYRIYRADFGLDDLRSFTISPSGLRFYFSTYQVGPYSDEEYSVKVPFSVVLDCIPQHSPARRFMKQDSSK